MNVDTFSENPSIKWYFISAIPFMLGVLVLWYLVKHLLARQRQTPYQRGIYENFFHNMATSNPRLWSRSGPRDYILPKSRLGKIKWFLIRRWSAPERTIRSDHERGTDAQDDLGTVSKMKRYLIKYWTEQIAATHDIDQSTLDLEAGELVDDDDDVVGDGDGNHGNGGDYGKADDIHIVADGLANATEMLTIPATPAAEHMFDRLAPPDTHNAAAAAAAAHSQFLPQAWSTALGRRHRRSSSAGRNSGVVIEEEDSQWLSRQGEEGRGFIWRTSSSRDRSRDRKGDDGGGEEGENGGNDNNAANNMNSTATAAARSDGNGGNNTGDRDRGDRTAATSDSERILFDTIPTTSRTRPRSS